MCRHACIGKRHIYRIWYSLWFGHPLGVLECILCGQGGLMYCCLPILQLRNLRLGRATRLAQGYTTRRESRNLNPGLPDPGLDCFLNTCSLPVVLSLLPAAITLLRGFPVLRGQALRPRGGNSLSRPCVIVSAEAQGGTGTSFSQMSLLARLACPTGQSMALKPWLGH